MNNLIIGRIILAIMLAVLMLPIVNDMSEPSHADSPYITKAVDFERWSSGGWYSNTAYADVSSSARWLYTAANFNGTVEMYFEADLVASAGNTAYAQLTWEDNTAVVGSEVSTTQTVSTRVRSANISANMTDAKTYKARVKTSAGTLYGRGARLIIVQSGTVTATETEIMMTDNINPGGAAYIDSAAGSIFYYDADQFDGTVSIYFEGVATGWTTAYYRLCDASNNVVDGTTHSRAGGAGLERWRSNAITLSDNTEYHVEVYGGLIYYLKVIIIQSGSPTKTETYYDVEGGKIVDSYGQTASQSWIYWDESDWGSSTKSVFHESTLKTDNASYAASCLLFDAGGTHSTLTTTNVALTRYRSAAQSLNDHTLYDIKTGANAPNNAHQVVNGSRLIVQATFGSSSPSLKPYSFGIIIY
jgi:hypothetical protein